MLQFIVASIVRGKIEKCIAIRNTVNYKFIGEKTKLFLLCTFQFTKLFVSFKKKKLLTNFQD